jgi:transposase
MPLQRLRIASRKTKSAGLHEQKKLESRLGAIPGAVRCDGDVLNLPGWRVTGYIETDDDIVIWAALTADLPLPCDCGAPPDAARKWGSNPETYVHDLPIRNKRTRVYFKQRRYRCACGKSLLPELPGLDGRRRLTARLAGYIEREAFDINRTFLDLEDEMGVSDRTIRDIFTERAERLERERVIETPRWLAIDEVHLGKRVHCVITDPVGRKALDMLPDNSQPRLGRWLLQLPDRHRVEVVTMDMWPAYWSAVRQVLKQARIVVDRYHVHNMLNMAVKDVLQVIRDCMTTSEQRKYMRDPRLLLMSRHHLSDQPTMTAGRVIKPATKDVVATWLEDLHDLGRAYWLKEGLSDILHLTDRAKAEERLDAWLKEVRSFTEHFSLTYERKYQGIWTRPFANVVTTVNKWRDMILNYIDCKHLFDATVSNGFAESTNRLIKQAHLRGGSYTYEVLRIKVIHGGLLVKRRPPHPLKQVTKTAEKGQAGKRRGKNTGNNPNANVVRLERVREEKDETKNLLDDKPREDAKWLARFGHMDQVDLGFDEGPWEPPKRGKGRRKEKEKPRSSRKALRTDDDEGGQMEMF